MSKTKLFLVSLVATIAAWLVIFLMSGVDWRGRIRLQPKFVPISQEVFITSQLLPADVLRLGWVKTLVDIRPDGEVKDQPSSAEIAAAANQSKISFNYIPVPHESIPPTAVEALSTALARDPKPVVLFCRTGRRAVRLFALEEAGRPDGPTTDAILAMVRKAGFTADDLKGEIEKRLARRPPTLGTAN